MLNATKKMKIENVFGSTIYFLGQDKNGRNYFLENARFDCEWYFAGGYIESYTNNNNPKCAKDKVSHNHFDSMFLNDRTKCCFDKFKEFFVVNPFTDKEIWTICEIMSSFYTMRRYSDLLHIGGSHITTNPSNEIIKNKEEYERINKVVIPNLMENLYKILAND